MAVHASRVITIGDQVAILPREANFATEKPRTATVTYVGPLYIRLSDGTTYSTIGLESLGGDENTRIELITQR
jgi:hypothetical protein